MFVCAANVCRSQLMALALTAELKEAAVKERWTIVSRGTDVHAKLPTCELVTAMYSAPRELRNSTSHSRALDAQELDQQHLILTATREERGVVARARPDLRPRTFTLNEATLLGAESPSSAELDRLMNGDPTGRLAGYADLLNARRPRVALQPESRGSAPLAGFFNRTARRGSSPLDVPDVHHLRAPAHARTLRETAAQVRVLAEQLRGVLELVSQPH